MHYASIMGTMASKLHNLDYKKLYGLQLDFDPAEQTLRVSVSNRSEPWPRLRKALQSLVNIDDSAGNQIKPSHSRANAKSVTFHGVSREFTLKLGLEPIGQYSVDSEGKLSLTERRILTSSEIRRIGTFHRAMPYAQRLPELSHEENSALLKKARTAVFTDFHSHSSGQISSKGLIDVGLAHDAYYPLEWLQEAGIDVNYQRFPKNVRREEPRVRFEPRIKPGEELSPTVESVPLRALTQTERDKLERLMAMPSDRQSTFSEMENDAYYFRYPLTKNPALTKDVIKQTAREYVLDGVKYATLSYVGLDKPETLRAVHEAMQEIEQDPVLSKVKLRFKVGVPRTMPLPKVEETLEKAKILLDSPYIVGIDLLGYELNKTKKFSQLLDGFCKWANDHKPGCTVRAHAGENDKNLGNVNEMLDIAVKYPNLHFSIGHGVYGMDEKTIARAEELCADPENPRLTIEPNPASVIALNNVDDLKQIPFETMVKYKIPFVVSSDSAGIYHTSPLQLGLEAFYGGLRSEGFDQLIHHQTVLMNKQLSFCARNAADIAGWQQHGHEAFMDQTIERLGRVPAAVMPRVKKQSMGEIREKLAEQGVMLVQPHERLPELDRRRPVTIVGASGDSWARMSDEARRESAIALDMVTHALNPEIAFIENGRPKAQGVPEVLRRSIAHANDNSTEPASPLYNYGFQAEPNFEEIDTYKHFSHLEVLPGKLLDLSSAIVNRTFQRQGVLIAIGGAAFTRDIITKADQRDILADNPGNRKMMLLLQCAEGASAEKARVLSPDYRALDGRQLLSKLYKHSPELFAADFDISKLDAYYQAAAARVNGYKLDAPDTVIEAAKLFQDRQHGIGRA